MIYSFRCRQEHDFEVSAPIQEGPPRELECPICGEESKQVFSAPPIHYNTQGFHTTDYDSQGDKLERFNKNWEKKYGEKAPPPAKDVPKNGKDIY